MAISAPAPAPQKKEHHLHLVPIEVGEIPFNTVAQFTATLYIPPQTVVN